ncbi:hypothetical protein LSTR_LSTR004197 [Laodelphax striatellus]|uniref:Tumor suppressor candidate 2 n=1 Tax=Laodelphax striatellus TaxID=195883 RepID=A0A482X9P0_LAOST|nr:hypothetical protein LSTR_LSTR004197 [Laodelphax striatellus]
MGSNGSKFVKKIVSPFNHGGGDTNSSEPNTNSSVAGPIVLSRQGSMYFDEDGDLAHEFYIEELPSEKGSKARMRRIVTNLKPQGEVLYSFPRLRSDFPMILYQV